MGKKVYIVGFLQPWPTLIYAESDGFMHVFKSKKRAMQYIKKNYPQRKDVGLIVGEQFMRI